MGAETLLGEIKLILQRMLNIMEGGRAITDDGLPDVQEPEVKDFKWYASKINEFLVALDSTGEKHANILWKLTSFLGRDGKEIGCTSIEELEKSYLRAVELKKTDPKKDPLKWAKTTYAKAKDYHQKAVDEGWI